MRHCISNQSIVTEHISIIFHALSTPRFFGTHTMHWRSTEKQSFHPPTFLHRFVAAFGMPLLAAVGGWETLFAHALVHQF